MISRNISHGNSLSCAVSAHSAFERDNEISYFSSPRTFRYTENRSKRQNMHKEKDNERSDKAQPGRPYPRKSVAAAFLSDGNAPVVCALHSSCHVPCVPQRRPGHSEHRHDDSARRAVEGSLLQPDFRFRRLRAGICHRAAGGYPDGVVQARASSRGFSLSATFRRWPMFR